MLHAAAFDEFYWDKLAIAHLAWIARNQSHQEEGNDCDTEDYRDKLEQVTRQITIHLVLFKAELNKLIKIPHKILK